VTYGVRSLARYNPVEGFITGSLREVGSVDYGVYDQRVCPGVGDVDPMIFPGESDWGFRPT
jgi:hypothetical protein